MKTPPSPLTYSDAGVDIAKGNALVERIKPIAKRTARPEVLNGLGGFGALFAIPSGYQEPILVSSTDGVGTKLKLAVEWQQHAGIGIDLVAMCVNDIIVQGAEPLFFLDYFATGRLDVEVATEVIRGIGKGCELAGASLIGGETAEMPGVYQNEDYDLAGFAVGIVERSRLIDGSRVKPGDKIIGLASSGVHANGFSLVRKILALHNTDPDMQIDGKSLHEQLMAPTRIYVKAILSALATIEINAIAHITGGGLIENIPRVLPAGTLAHITTKAWPRPAIFDWLQQSGHISDHEMARTFNCGIGLVLCVPPEIANIAIHTLHAAGEKAWVIGEIEATDAHAPSVVLQ